MDVYPAQRQQCRPCVILGNGPSLRGFDFAEKLKGFDTFGMNVAYRYWDTANWYPTYYSCLDSVVGMHHQDAIARLIERAEEYGIRAFLLRNNLVTALKKLGTRPYVYDHDALIAKDYRFLRGYWANTGSITTAWAAMMGYKDIILLGIHGVYVKLIKEAGLLNEFVLKITSDPESNPNYFFDEYQQAGDLYHLPVWENPEFPHEDQIFGWHMVRPQIAAHHAVVVNANPTSQVKAFPIYSFENALSAINQIRTERQEENRQWENMLPEEHTREQGVFLDTIGLLKNVAPKHPGVMIDIGAHHGESCMPFAHEGWKIFAFEPDKENQKIMHSTLQGFGNITFDGRAASCVSGREYPWNEAPESTELSAMVGFLPSHAPTGTVKTITLRDYCKRHSISTVDILKVDTVGFDLMVLRGFPLETIRPSCIVCAFDNRKSIPLGSDMHDLGSFFLGYGYHVFMSEWYPILQYGQPAQWRRFVPYPEEPAEPGAWGHFFAFTEKPMPQELAQVVRNQITVGISPVSPPRTPLAMPEPRYVLRY